MKKSILAIILLATISAHAQSDKYTAAMQQNLQLLDSAKTPEQLTAVSQAFERIGDAEKTQWLPYYYAALAQTRIGFSDPKSDRDAIGQKANELAAKGEAIEKNADLCSIHNMAATIQLLVNPMERWKTYGLKAYTALQEGYKLDPNNPRLYFLEGSSLFSKPEYVGGGKDKAKPVFEKAVQLFHAEKTAPLYPHWGLKETERLLALCK
ncbi:MAG TPA: hypothetical protein VFS25_05080 [Chitinophaga sp.]|uniref:hypothetical protein n=1 Tax=Chitinophaga sp. TaxID=1869181 RepID=UPI002DBBCEA0|nr:hypothetical protein [Chitinophaga sp.]HEU4552181.1 hypothetical protein [Chitinophaga sp.]